MEAELREKLSEFYDEQLADGEEAKIDEEYSGEGDYKPSDIEAPKEEEETSDKKEEEAKEEDEDPQLEAEEPQQPTNVYEEVLTPPSFNEEERQLFSNIKDKEAKKLINEFVARRDLSLRNSVRKNIQTLNTKFEEYAGKYKALDKLEQEHKDVFESKGITPIEAASNALAWDQALAQDPVTALTELAEQYGVSMSFQDTGYSPAPRQDGQYLELQKDLAELKEAYQGITQQEQTRVQQAVLGEVKAFTSAKDASGNLKYPLVEYVAHDMQANIPFVQAENPGLPINQVLEMAYDRAVWANPQTRQIVQNKSSSGQPKPAKKSSSLETQNHAAAKPSQLTGRAAIEAKYDELFSK